MGGGGGGPDWDDGPDQSGGGGSDDGVPPETEPEGWLPGDVEDCEFDEEVMLDSPKAGPLSSVSVGDVLPVDVRDNAVVVVDDSDRVVGSIVEPWSAALKECIEQGYEYDAEVLRKHGGSCDVRVTNR